MTTNINIRRDVQDSFYRYKMPKLLSKIEGKGNGIKTVIPNMADIAKALHRPASYPTKYFGSELGAQVKMDEPNDRYIVNGAHDAPKLQQILDGFITRFVLCGECLNPETDLVILKNGDITRDCKACGKSTLVDMRHKLTTYIVKNPPGAQAGARYANTAASQPSSKQSKKSSKKDDKEPKDDGSEDNSQQSDSEELNKRMAKEAAEMPADHLLKSSLDDWSVDTSSDAAAARQKNLGGLSEGIARQLNLVDDEEDDGNDPMEELASYIEGNKAVSDAEIMQKITELSMSTHKAVVVLIQTLFDQDMPKQMKQRAALFQKLVTNEKEEKAFLGGLERFVGVVQPSLLPKIALILKEAYDLDLLDEEVVIAWGKKNSKKYVSKEINKEVRKKAEPFLQWLENAEEEESSDEEDE